MGAAITAKHLKYQLADTHHANPAKRASSTFKNYFTAILSGCHIKFSPSVWFSLLCQAGIADNLICPSCINPKLSAYHQVFDLFDFNSTAIAPLGTQAIIYKPKSQRKSTLASHGSYGWCTGPAIHLYRKCQIYVPATRGTHIGKTVQFLSTTFIMSTTFSADKVIILVEELIHKIENSAPASAFTDIGTITNSALYPFLPIQASS